MNPRAKGILAALFNYAFIGLSFLFTKNSVEQAPTFIVLFLRFLLSFAILTPIIVYLGGVSLVIQALKADWRQILLFATFQPLFFFAFQAMALERIDSSEVGVISAISPVIVAILGSLLLHERLSRIQTIGLTSSVGGLLVIYFFKGIFSQISDVLGIIFALLATLSASAYQVLGRHLSQKFDPLSLAYIRASIGMVVFFLLAAVFNGLFSFSWGAMADVPKFLVGIGFLAIFTTVGTSLLTVYSLKRLKAAEQGIFANLATIISIIAGIVLLQESFGWYQILGSLFVIAGVIMMNLSSKMQDPIEKVAIDNQ